MRWYDFVVTAMRTEYPIKVIERTVPCNNYLRCLFIFILPLHVSAFAGHLQEECSIFLGSAFHLKIASEGRNM
jgi:hypothetical protein